ncbi:RNA polymerase sigma factor [Gaoshiqia sp. Z1-71]|uniref:RNA polymerase sigma factor n=1 Tax=Gaoshiqia hydrogeniformans TaxID=3290090 RepID=UPI003BF892BF
MKITPDINNQELTGMVRAGSKEAFRLLYERYARNIHRFACSYLKSDQDAEELVQDVFLKVWEKRHTLDYAGNIRAFIFRDCFDFKFKKYYSAINTKVFIIKKLVIS